MRSPSAALDPDQLRTLVELRRDLHQYPELRFAELRTAVVLRDRLSGVADEIVAGVAGTGLLVIVRGRTAGPRVLLRADMDAYPIQDATPHSYASRLPGVAHACGHDVHMAVLVGALERIAAERPDAGEVWGLFQPAEEIPFGEESGARAVLESGVLGTERYAAVLGLHSWPDLPAGTIGVDPRVSMAAKDAFRIVISGANAHAATPARGRDTVVAVSALVSGLYQACARRHDPDEMVALNIGTIEGGTVQSAVPARSSITGTLRTHDPAVRERLRRVIDEVSRGIATQFDVAVELVWANAMDAVLNSPRLVALANEVLPDVAEVVAMPSSPMTTDDFAILTQLGEGLYVKLGVRDPAVQQAAPLHSSEFDVDERCLGTGVLALETLTRHVLRDATVLDQASGDPSRSEGVRT